MRAADNELLTRVGPDTPGGRFMRQYWVPALMSSELEAGGAPLRLRLLGENFVAFRSPDGQVGIIDHRCAHRCASLFLGRNESGGIRCVYHGWQFAPNGQCVDMPSEPPETEFSAKVRLKAAKIHEAFGVIWAYLGRREEAPGFPEFDIDKIPPEELTVRFTLRECNWLQALEGDIDTVHVGFLHTGGAKPEQFEKGSLRYYGQKNRAPKYEAIPTRYGAMYTAYRPADDGELYHRVGQFVYPFYAMSPPDPMGTIGMRGWIPVDDTHTMAVQIHGRRPSVENLKQGPRQGGVAGAVLNFDYLPNTTDWYGRWRLRQNSANDYMLDRERQHSGNYTGIEGIYLQDQAVTESMGPTSDRTHEHLGSSDRMVMLSRRQMLNAIIEFADSGAAPPGVDDPELFRSVRAGYMILPEQRDWLDEVNRYRKEWGGAAVPAIERTDSVVAARA